MVTFLFKSADLRVRGTQVILTYTPCIATHQTIRDTCSWQCTLSVPLPDIRTKSGGEMVATRKIDPSERRRKWLFSRIQHGSVELNQASRIFLLMSSVSD